MGSSKRDDHSRRNAVSVEAAVLVLAGLFLAALGPFGTGRVPAAIRSAYWLICIVGGGAIGIALDSVTARWVPSWRRTLFTVFAMTPLVTVWVLGANHLFLGDAMDAHVMRLLLQVFIISLALMTVRALARRTPGTVVETRTVVVAPLPETERAFRQHLSAKRRPSRLIAIEAQDHYLQVYTSAGPELILMRLSDALRELDRANGFQVHRSWWVAADAIRTVRWSRGSGEVHLEGEIVAPVSRRFAPVLREAGWRSGNGAQASMGQAMLIDEMANASTRTEAERENSSFADR